MTTTATILPAAIRALLAAATTASAAAATQPNIVFFLSDDHAPHAISSIRQHLSYGNHLANSTPNIDRLADQGTMFPHCYCENSICGPSRAAILTGKYSHLHGYRGNIAGYGEFNPNQQHLGILLRDAGYDTAIFGKWHLKYGGTLATPVGFNTYAVHSSAGGQGNYYQPVYASNAGTITTAVGTYSTDFTTDMSLDWLNGSVSLNSNPYTRDTGKPFALFCQFKAPHSHWIPGPQEIGLWRDFTGDGSPDVGLDPAWGEPATLHEAAASWPGRSDAIDRNTMRIQQDLNDDQIKFTNLEASRMTAAQIAVWNSLYGPENTWFQNNLASLPVTAQDRVRWLYQRYSKDYLRCVAGVDRNVGRILDWLDSQPAEVRDNTIVVYSADQGFFIGDHGLFDKRWMYEESLRMPFLIRWPARIPAGRVLPAMVQNIDFAPTLLDAAGAAIPRDMQGRTFLPMAGGTPQPDWRNAVYYQYYEDFGSNTVSPHHGIRTATHKLIHFYWNDNASQSSEMYDLVNDPDELQSIYGQPANQQQQADLEARLLQLRKFYRIPGTTPLRAYESFQK